MLLPQHYLRVFVNDAVVQILHIHFHKIFTSILLTQYIQFGIIPTNKREFVESIEKVYSFVSIIIVLTEERSRIPSSANLNIRLGTPIAMGVYRWSAFFCSSILICLLKSFGM